MAFTGASAECVVDTTYDRLVVGDGATTGGFPAGSERRLTVNDATGAPSGVDRIVAYTALTAGRTVNLPAAASYPWGARLVIVDETGNCSSSKTITVAPNGTDTINGVNASVVLSAPFAFIELESNNTASGGTITPGTGWTIVGQSNTVAQAPNGASMQLFVVEILSATLSGATVTLTNAIPAGATVFAIGAYIPAATAPVTASGGSLTGIYVGYGSGGQLQQWGYVGPSSGASSVGNSFLSFSAATSVILSINGTATAFTGGKARISVHYMLNNPSNS